MENTNENEFSTKTWYKNIENPGDTPWLDWIESGIKKYEGRIYRGDWVEMKVGDTIVFTCGDKQVKTIVTELLQFANFGVAYYHLRKDLVPLDGINILGVVEIYSKIPGYTFEEIRKHGVVAVGLKSIY